jgi:RimJ/RimL family protein N-acetyltransferase
MEPFLLRTERLLIDPLVPDDAAAFSAIADDPGVARMMSSIPHPFSEGAAREWIRGRQWKAEPGFCTAIRLRHPVRSLIGLVGVGGDPVNSAYLLGRAYWGLGYATEAMAAFLSTAFDRFGLESITASAFADNPASFRVLEKLGFVREEDSTGTSLARVESAPTREYRLTRAEHKSALPESRG